MQGVKNTLATVIATQPLLAHLRELSFPLLCQAFAIEPVKYKRLFRRALLVEHVDPYYIIGTSAAKTATVDPYGPVLGTNVCHVCFQCLEDEGARAAHAAKFHKIRSEAALWANGTACWGCGVQFWSVSRLHQHLNRRRPNPCMAAYKSLNLPLSTDQRDALNERTLAESRAAKAVGLRPHHAGR